ncbi:MAG: hypothetical protein M0Q51_16310 [Bacteroidales bacterium]|nr:hypothetical protein [Bacteroidales bacterium]
MPSEAQIRKTIRDIILLTDRINLDGGTATSAQQYRWLLLKKHRLFQAAGIEYTQENLQFLFDMPFNPIFNITDPCNVNLCPHMERKMWETYVDGIVCDVIPLVRMDHKSYSLESKVNDVIYCIVGLTGRALE